MRGQRRSTRRTSRTAPPSRPTGAPTARPASAATSSATRASSRPSTRSPATRARPAPRARPSPAARACPRARPSPPSPRPATYADMPRSERPMRRARSNTHRSALIALAVIVGRRLPRLDQGDPVPLALRGQGRVRDLQQPAHRLAGADRRRRGRQGHRRRARRGRRRRDRDDADRGQGPAGARRRDGQDPPAHLPRGQLLRRPRRPARRRRPSSTTAPRFPVQQTATPVQLDEVLTALQSDTREDLKIAAARVRRRRSRARAPAASTARSRTGSPPTATRRSSPRRCWARPGTTSPATSTHAGATAGALDRNREQLKSLITDFHTTARRVRAPGRATCAAASPSCRARCAPSMPALAALNESFPPLRALAQRAAAGRAELRGDARRLAAVRPAAARPRLRARAARPGRRPAPDRARRSPR